VYQSLCLVTTLLMLSLSLPFAFADSEFFVSEDIGFGDTTIHDIFFLDSNNGWAIDEDTLFITTNGGESWIIQFSFYDGGLNKVYFLDSDHGFILNDDGMLFYTSSGGYTWQPKSLGLEDLNAITFQSNGVNGVIVGDGGVLFNTENGGVSWDSQDSKTTDNLNDVAVNKDTFYVVSDNGYLLDSSNGGVNWSLKPLFIGNSLNSLHFISSITGFGVIVGDGIIFTSKNLMDWDILINDSSLYFNDVFIIDDYNFWAVGDDGIIFTLTDQNLFSYEKLCDEDLNIIHIKDNQESILILGDNSKIISNFLTPKHDAEQCVSVLQTDKNGGGGSDYMYMTKPTFGLSHQTYKQIVDDGFSFNGIPYDITHNWHTEFPIQNVTLGEQNTFTAKTYATNKLMLQEFLFGIPEVGSSYKAELEVEIWYDIDGIIEEIKVIQETNVVDPNSVNVNHSMVYCQPDDYTERCDETILTMTFLEPLYYDIMAIKAVDHDRYSHTTYLNEGFDISGISLNPMLTLMILSPERFTSIVEVTQTAKYSDVWETEDGKLFEINKYGSITWINQSHERHADPGEAKNRLHSAFVDRIIQQQEIAQETLDNLYKSSETITRDDLLRLVRVDVQSDS